MRFFGKRPRHSYDPLAWAAEGDERPRQQSATSLFRYARDRGEALRLLEKVTADLTGASSGTRRKWLRAIDTRWPA